MLTLHLSALFFSFVVIVLSDREGALWMAGKRETLEKSRIVLYHYLVWGGLSAMILSGVGMAWGSFGDLLTEPLFLLKMFFVGLLVANGFVIGNISHIATSRSFASLGRKEKIPLFISGGISLVGWLGAATAAVTFF